MLILFNKYHQMNNLLILLALFSVRAKIPNNLCYILKTQISLNSSTYNSKNAHVSCILNEKADHNKRKLGEGSEYEWWCCLRPFVSLPNSCKRSWLSCCFLILFTTNSLLSQIKILTIVADPLPYCTEAMKLCNCNCSDP